MDTRHPRSCADKKLANLSLASKWSTTTPFRRKLVYKTRVRKQISCRPNTPVVENMPGK